MSFTIDYDCKLTEPLDLKKKSKWKFDKPPAAARNKLWRIVQKQSLLLEHVYQTITNKTKLSEKQICHALGLTSFQEVNFSKIVLWLIYCRKFVGISIIHSILTHFQQKGVAANVQYANQKTRFCLDKCMYQNVLSVFGDYCDMIDILHLAVCSRLWQDTICDKKFISNCKNFQKFTLTSKHVCNWKHNYSSWWYFNGLKILKIATSLDHLRKFNFPQPNSDTIQFLDSSVYYLKKSPTSLKTLKMNGCYPNEQYWPLKKQCHHTLSFTVIVKDYFESTQYIPPSSSVLYDNCSVSMKTFINHITSKTTQWIGLQNCNVSTPSVKSDIGPIAGITAKKLMLIDSGTWMCNYMFLKYNGIYQNYICQLTIVNNVAECSPFTIMFLSFLSNISEGNKGVSILFYCDENTIDNVAEYKDKINYIYRWCTDKYYEICCNLCIHKFVFGLVYKTGHGLVGDTFDLKQIKNVQDLQYHHGVWQKVLFDEQCTKSAESWLTEFGEPMK